MKRIKYIVNGRVQGVGFRPFVFRLARKYGLTGLVKNTSQGVVIEAQGPEENLEGFFRDLAEASPPLAEIVSMLDQEMDFLSGETEFSIKASTGQDRHQVLISPDWAICRDCTREVLDPLDRRYLYPFTNCTNCGPRYTITGQIPYDRRNTSMACFDMCPACMAEYRDPDNRRFHAQPNACPLCGPRVRLTGSSGEPVFTGLDPLAQSASLLKQGRIMAIKGLGGFHLACHATDHEAVLELRRRKNRLHKPLAVMVPALEDADALAVLSREEKEILRGQIRPILAVIPRKSSPLSPALAPDTERIGIMLAYTPLHLVLFEHLKKLSAPVEALALVMTSGNTSSEPICLGNREALERLGRVADYFLLHNRDILVRCDDSVAFVQDGKTGFYRRARGYTPGPVFLKNQGESVLGVGPELKNTVCLTKRDQAFVSQHIGDLKNLESYSFFLECIRHLEHILRTKPKAVVCDLHPDYLSTRFARDESGLPVYALQHHFAHILSVMAENRFQGPCLGLALDGAGLGDDGTLWGGELLFVDNNKLSMHRLGCFQPVALPGGDKAVQEPWRVAAGFLHRLGRNIQFGDTPDNPIMIREQELLKKMLEQNINSPLSTGCGRLFDAVAALLGLVRTISYEGQGAVLLEKIQDPGESGLYHVPVVNAEQGRILDTLTLFEQICRDRERGVAPAVISRRFHLSLARALCRWVQAGAEETGVRHVGLSGGVMQNLTLSRLLVSNLSQAAFNVLTHKSLPPNDACISLGQAVFGRELLRHG